MGSSHEYGKCGPTRLGIGMAVCLMLALMGSSIPATASGDEENVNKRLNLDQKWTGDFDDMAKRRMIRVLVTYSKTNYFLDGFEKRGVTHELLSEFEKYVNKMLHKRDLKIHLVVIPVARDRLIPDLIDGRADIAAAGLTVTPGRRKQVDFADPIYSRVKEIVVCNAHVPRPGSVSDLSGREVTVRPSSSYWESLSRLNESLKKKRKPPVKLRAADEYLEDEDLLEMVNAGLIPMVVVDDYLARFWSQVFGNLVLCPDVALSGGGEIAWMIRKQSPELKRVINRFMKEHQKGTLLGNILFNRYLKNTEWVRNSLDTEEVRRFEEAAPYFMQYGQTFGFDWLRVAAVGYQESRIDQSKRSPAGAIGVMQLLPETAAGHPVNIPGIETMEPNIHAGVKYLKWIQENYFADRELSPLNSALFTIASYNAGPARIQQFRKEASAMGLDPNVWFRNVEIVAARRIGRETVQYVSNIYKYYVAYRLLCEHLDKKGAARRPDTPCR